MTSTTCCNRASSTLPTGPLLTGYVSRAMTDAVAADTPNGAGPVHGELTETRINKS